MTREEQIRARLKAATPAPWLVKHAGSADELWSDRGLVAELSLYPRGSKSTEADAKFIANAPDDIAYLLEDNARLRATLEAIV